MNAGQLDSTITILEKGPATGSWGAGGAATWVPKFEGVPADVRHVSGSEAIRADAVVSTVRASIRIRYLEGVTAAMRVQEGSTVYAIKSVLMDVKRREYTDLVCELTT